MAKGPISIGNLIQVTATGERDTHGVDWYGVMEGVLRVDYLDEQIKTMCIIPL